MALRQHCHCFVRMLDSVVGVTKRTDIDHPYMPHLPVWHHTMMELQIMPLIEKIWPEDSWQTEVSQGKLAKAEEMPAERLRRNQQSSLLA